jgi:hypothetical protein
MHMPDQPDEAWRVSSYSGGQGNCVEVAIAPAGVLLRDTKDRSGGVLSVSPDSWGCLLARCGR